MAPPAYFTRAGDRFVPAPHARSWWAPKMLHGRLLGGLLARTLEAEHGAPGLRFGRLTVDLFRNAPLEPVEVTSLRIRDGHRIRVTEATLTSEIGLVARATAVQLRASEQPPGRVAGHAGLGRAGPAHPAARETRFDPATLAVQRGRPAPDVDARARRLGRRRGAFPVRAGRARRRHGEPARPRQRRGPGVHQRRLHAVPEAGHRWASTSGCSRAGTPAPTESRSGTAPCTTGSARSATA